MSKEIEAAILAERERCAKIAEYCARGAAMEFQESRHLLLGIMQRSPADAQRATAHAIAAAIRCNPLDAQGMQA